jgi:hypothetical protein
MGHIYIYWLYTYIFQLLSMLYIYIFQLLCVVCILSFIWTSSCIYRMLVVCQVYISCVSFMICLYNLECSGIYIYIYICITYSHVYVHKILLSTKFIYWKTCSYPYIYIYIIIYNINSLPLAGPYLTYDATEGNGRTGDACKNRTWKLQPYRNHLCKVLDKIHTVVNTTIKRLNIPHRLTRNRRSSYQHPKWSQSSKKKLYFFNRPYEWVKFCL